MAFFDGHTRTVPLDELWQLNWHREFKLTGRISQ